MGHPRIAQGKSPLKLRLNGAPNKEYSRLNLLSSHGSRICLISVVLVVITLPIAAADSSNQQLTPKAVLSVMERVADWQLAHPSAHPATDWTQGAGDAGMMALAGISGNPKYRDAMLAMGEANGWKPGPRVYHADDLVVGQTYAGLPAIHSSRNFMLH
jgi:hypothetical protein